MADEADKGGEKGVMANLPSTRPSRMGRRARPAERPAAGAAKARPAAAKAKPAAAKRKPAAAKAKPAAAKAKPAAAKAKPKLAVAGNDPTQTPTAPRRPRAVRPASHALQAPPATAEERRGETGGRPSQSPTELLGTVVQAAGELASIGLTLGGQVLKRAADKLPRP